MIPQSLQDHLGTLLPGGGPERPIALLSQHSVGGGCIHNATAIRTEIGTYFLKWNHAREADNFAKESRGLQLLRAAGAIPVPEVIATGVQERHAFLLMEFIEEGARSSDFWEDFGRKLAKLHRNTQTHFGLDFDNYIGALPQYNSYRDHWIDFFIDQRLEKQAQMARERKLWSPSDQKALQQLYRHLPDLIPEEPPSLLHGDLWSGNFLCGREQGPVLIDPAVYYGHREAELAFTRLFGGFNHSFYAAYQEQWPLQAGWEERIDLYNLYPLMVHLNLFGRSYLPQIQGILQRFS